MKQFIFSACFLSLFVMAGCHSEEEHHREEVKFLVTSPLRHDTVITHEYVCQIHAIQHIEMRALEKGYLQNIYVDEGQTIKKGQRMFQIMPMIYEAELQKAQAEVNFAEIELKNTQKLADNNVVSENELALVKAKYDKAKAELSLAQVHLSFTDIRAPFDGIMDRFHVRLGSLLDEGELLTVISDNSKMWVYFNVPEAEYLDYRMRTTKDSLMTVRLMMANNRIFDQIGVIETIEADFNNETGNIAFRATFPNPNALLRHGETGNILLDVPMKKALLIPQKATFEILDKKYIYVVDDSSIVRARHISVAEEMPHIYAIKEGLQEGDKILVEGIRKVHNGEKIHYEYHKPEEVLTHLELYAE